MTSNIAKSYNSVLKGAKGLPVRALVRKVFYNCVIHWEEGRAIALKKLQANEVFTKYAMDKIAKWRAQSNTHQVTAFHRGLSTFQVITEQSTTSEGWRRGNQTQGGRPLELQMQLQ